MQPEKLLFGLILATLFAAPGCVGGRTQTSLAAPTGPTKEHSLPTLSTAGRDSVPATVKVPAWAVVKDKVTEFNTPAEARVTISLYRRDEATEKETNRILNEMAELKEYERVEANGWAGYRRRLDAPGEDGPMRFGGYTMRNESLVLNIQLNWPGASAKAKDEADTMARHILFSIKPHG